MISSLTVYGMPFCCNFNTIDIDIIYTIAVIHYTLIHLISISYTIAIIHFTLTLLISISYTIAIIHYILIHLM